MNKRERLQEFYRRLLSAPPARSFEEAYGQIYRILNEAEDELSGIRYNNESSKWDGRLYPPLWDARRPIPRRADVMRFRTARHYVMIGMNGAIRIIEALGGKIELQKSGEDGRKVGEL